MNFHINIPRIAKIGAVVVALGIWSFFFAIDRAPAPGAEAYMKVYMAARAHARTLKTSGVAPPKFVTLPELVATGTLGPRDAAAFAGMEVIVPLNADYDEPQSVIMSVLTPDEQWSAVLGDGSVQQLSRERLQALLRAE